MYKIFNLKNRDWNDSDIHYWVNPDDNCCNASIMFNGKRARLRAGIIILDGDMILLGEEADAPGMFSLPGGGLEFGESPVDAATREAQEEVRVNVKNAVDCGLDYCECLSELKDWVAQNVPEDEQWYNYYTCLVIGEYDSDFDGKVDAVDKDMTMLKTARWYNISDVLSDPSFKTQWKRAILNYLKKDRSKQVYINKDKFDMSDAFDALNIINEDVFSDLKTEINTMNSETAQMKSDGYSEL